MGRLPARGGSDPRNGSDQKLFAQWLRFHPQFKWGPISKEGCAGLGKGPEEVHKNDPWNEEFVVWGMVEDSGSVLIGV